MIDIDQSPIGRSSRSNPATYIGFYDAIRTLFAETDEAKRRGFTASTFSFNVKGGRCEECTGEGTITTQLSFMPDVEVLCPTCKGARYNQDTLEVKYQGKNIAEVLDLSVEEGVEFFADQPAIARKIAVLNELGLGYLKLGHPSTILSGGEAQRVKLAGELGKLKRGKHNLYILDEPTTGLHFADIDRLLRKPEPTGRHRPFGRRDRAQPGRDQDGRSRHRPRPGGRPQRRPTDRLRHSRGDRGVQGVAHRQVSGGAVNRVTAPGPAPRPDRQRPRESRGVASFGVVDRRCSGKETRNRPRGIFPVGRLKWMSTSEASPVGRDLAAQLLH